MHPSSTSLLQNLNKRLANPSRTYALGVSGGLDSMVLVESFHRLDIPFRALHFNHCLRGTESDADAQWVREWCRKRGISVNVRSWKNPEVSEDCARRARYRFFRDMMKRHQLTCLVLGHHMDDLAETFLLQLLRGAGPSGLSSLRTLRSFDSFQIERPLLHLRKSDLKKIAREWKLSWREDDSNRSSIFLRNRVRHRLLPYLRRLTSRDPVPLLARTSVTLQEEEDYWHHLLPHPPPTTLSVRQLRSLHPAHQRRLIRHWLAHHQPSMPDFNTIEAVRKLVQADSPARVNLKKHHTCRRRQGILFIEPVKL